MRIGIAGFGTVGRVVAELFGGGHELVIADPPLGIGALDDLNTTDIAFICVPTPSLPNGACDTRIVEQVVARVRPQRALVCHSTVSIGTTDRLIAAYDRPLVYVPEYAGESPDHYYRQPGRIDFAILGGYEPAVSDVQALFRSALGPEAQLAVVPPQVAETAKYMENAFLALKVAFCNEFHDLAEAVGVDYDLLRQVWLLDHRVNPSHTVVTAERGYGGRCLPKDVAAVCHTAREVGEPLEILESAQRANRRRFQPAPASPTVGAAASVGSERP